MKELPGKWLSGDYTSATDGLHQDFFHAGLSTLEEYVSPQLWALVKREMDPHTCEYPSQLEIPDVEQTNGQLMGSLLSFPLLCLANAFTLYKTLRLPLGKLPALIHGDDLLAKVTETQYQNWKDFCPTVGLELSLGKNYFSEQWGSIDSQIFFEGNRLGTGKFSALQSHKIDSLPLLVRRGVPKALLVSLFKEELIATPRSLDVSHKYGGIGEHGEPYDNLSKSVFHVKVRKTFQVRETLGGFIYTISRSLKDLAPKGYQEQQEIIDETEVVVPSAWKAVENLNTLVFDQNYDRDIDRWSVFSEEQDPILNNLVTMSRELYSRVVGNFDF